MSDIIDVEVEFDKIIEWCRSRRLLNDDWNKGTQEIENALSNFFEIAVDNKVSLPIQQERCDYFSCRLLLDSLLKSRDSSKTLLRGYTDPVLNALSSVISLYERNNTHLADSGVRLKQAIAYELTAVVKQNKENQHSYNQICNRLTELSRSIARKEETISQLRSNWKIDTKDITEEAIIDDLKQNEEELKTLVADFQSVVQSKTLVESIHYFACFNAYVTKKESIDSSLFPSLNTLISNSATSSAVLDILCSTEQREMILDDLYCLRSFYQERGRNSGDEHSVVFGCSEEIARVLNEATTKMISSYSELLSEMIDFIEGRFSVVCRLLNDSSYCQSIANEVIDEYTRLNRLKSTVSTTEEKKKSILCSIEEMTKQEKELKQYAKKLSKNIEGMLNDLLPKLHVTIVGIPSLFSICFIKQNNIHHSGYVLLSSSSVSFLVFVSE